MARAKGGLHKLVFADLMQFLQNIITAATGNPIAPTPTPSLTVLQGLYDDGVTKNNDLNEALDHVSMLRSDLAAHQKSIIDALTTYISYGEMVTGRDPVKLQSLGLPLRSQPSPPAPCGTVMGLVTSVGDSEGEMSGKWDAQIQADSYQIQLSADPVTPTSWVLHPDTVHAPHVRLTGLPSGQKRWMRVRASNRTGTGAWSDPSWRMIP
jgi:hypothetical protein